MPAGFNFICVANSSNGIVIGKRNNIPINAITKKALNQRTIRAVFMPPFMSSAPAGRLGSGQVNLSIFLFIYSNTVGFQPLYCSF